MAPLTLGTGQGSHWQLVTTAINTLKVHEYHDLEERSKISLENPRNIIGVGNCIAISLKRKNDDHLEKSLYILMICKV